jgi:hypothetical protein
MRIQPTSSSVQPSIGSKISCPQKSSSSCFSLSEDSSQLLSTNFTKATFLTRSQRFPWNIGSVKLCSTSWSTLMKYLKRGITAGWQAPGCRATSSATHTRKRCRNVEVEAPSKLVASSTQVHSRRSAISSASDCAMSLRDVFARCLCAIRPRYGRETGPRSRHQHRYNDKLPSPICGLLVALPGRGVFVLPVKIVP